MEILRDFSGNGVKHAKHAVLGARLKLTKSKAVKEEKHL
jgi:hypothetical protein